MTIDASKFLDKQGLAVESALLLATAVLDHLGRGETVEVSMVGMRGVPSSYFNVLLSRIVDGFGVGAMDGRVTFRFDTRTQREIFHGSLESVRRSVA
ncbi:MAG TPA: hypothetical protein VMD30_04330 [Tepidisphaeraceae bacterium]|nr:hypothetical protein [Tepidisphaeraceae bacterium]